MTWEELKEKALEKGCYENADGDALFLSALMFCKEGLCYTVDGYPHKPLAKNRTYDQMWQIMEALQ